MRPMNSFKRFEIPHLTLGMDMLSGETSLPKGAVRDALNVDIDRAGNFVRRSGYELAVTAPGCHSLWASPSGRGMFVCQDAVLSRVEPPNLTALYTLKSSDPVDFCEHNGDVFFSNRTTAGWIPADSTAPRSVGVPTPPAPTVAAGSSGGLPPGKYTVAITVTDTRGEESGSSAFVHTVVPAPSGGVLLTGLPNPGAGGTVRIYLSEPNGEHLYLTAWVPAGISQFLVGNNAKLRPLDSAFLSPLPPGEIIRALGGRVYTASGDTLWFSDPFRFGMCDRRHNFVVMEHPITIVEPVATGTFIGSGGYVWFLMGDPLKGDLRRVSSSPAVRRSSLLVSAEHFNPKVVPGDAPVALWLSATGYTVGLPDGNVIALQADRIRIDQLTSGRTTFVLRDGVKQAITPVSAQDAAYGTAIDSA